MKKVVSVGIEIPGNSDMYLSFSSGKSLLDADIVIFQPIVSNYDIDFQNSSYQGKVLYSEDGAFRLKEDMVRWQNELSILLDEGKTVFVFLEKFEKFFVHTGNKSVSGTGRSARVTNIVTVYDNYQFMPTKQLRLVASNGKSMKYVGKPTFLALWNNFRKYFRYENFINQKMENSILVTKSGSKSVAAHLRIGKGNLILLPTLHYEKSNFLKYDKKKDKSYWTDEAIALGSKLLSEIVSIDRALSSSSSLTPIPSWTDVEKYKTKKTLQLNKEHASVVTKIKTLSRKKVEIERQKEEEGELVRLLFESGKPLENAVIKALGALGFKAENFQEEDLEIDQIIVSPEGDRFIAETEGKDNSAINIDKLRQLSSNIQEDLEREEVGEPANGILFGNGFRLTEPENRAKQFTDKCLSTARKLNYILVSTSALYEIVKYVIDTKDTNFARLCRKAISESGGGIVSFPLPKKERASKTKS